MRNAVPPGARSDPSIPLAGQTLGRSRIRLSRSALIIAALFAAAAALPGLAAEPEPVPVLPGDMGRIEYPIQNDPASEGPAEGLGLRVDAPSFFQSGPGTQLGPVDLPIGEEQLFIAEYVIGPDARDGVFTATFTPVAITTAVAPPLDTLGRTAAFAIDRPFEMYQQDSRGSSPRLFPGGSNAGSVPWLNDPRQTFVLENMALVDHSFTLFEKLNTPRRTQLFPPAVADGLFEEDGLPDGLGYKARLSNARGEAAEFLFNLDASAQLITLARVGVTRGAGGFVYSMSGSAQDAVSGIQFLRLARGSKQETEGGGTFIIDGDVDNGPFVGEVALTPGAPSAGFDFSGLASGGVYTVGGRDVTGNLSFPPITTTILTTATLRNAAFAELPVSTMTGGFRGEKSVFPLGGLAQKLARVSVQVAKSSADQNTPIDVFVRASAIELFPEAPGFLVNGIGSTPLTLLGQAAPGALGQVRTHAFSPNMLLNGGVEIVLRAPDLRDADGEPLPAVAPALVAVEIESDLELLGQSPPGVFPPQSGGRTFPLLPNPNVAVEFDAIKIQLGAVTSAGEIGIQLTNERFGAQTQTVFSFRAVTNASFQGPVIVTVDYSRLSLPPGTSPDKLRLVRHGSWQQITDFVDTANSRVVGTAQGLGTFALVLGPGGAAAADTDTGAAVTELATAGAAFQAGGGEPVYLTPRSSVSFTAEDDVSGLQDILFLLDPPASLLAAGLSGATAGQFDRFTTPFALQEGVYPLVFGSLDKADNFSLLRSTELRSDGTPPLVKLAVAVSSGADGVYRLGEADAIGFTASDPALSGPELAPGAGLDRVFYLADRTPEECGFAPGTVPPADPLQAPGTCQNPAFTLPFRLPPGARTLRFFAADRVKNVSAVQTAQLEVMPDEEDLAPPLTSFVAGGAGGEFIDAQGNRYLAASRSAGFSVLDFGAPPTGAATTYFALDPSAELLAGGLSAQTAANFSVFTGTFTLGEGRRVLAFASVDKAANFEALRSTEVRVDGTPPAAAFAVMGSSATDAEGRIVLDDATRVEITAADPLAGAPAVASGVGELFYLLDLDPLACEEVAEDPASPAGTCSNPVFPGPLTLAVGTHTVFFAAADRVENESEFLSVSLLVEPAAVDTSSPSLALSPPHGSTVAVARPLIALFFSDAGSGVDRDSLQLTLDGVDIAAQTAVFAASTAFVPAADLDEGTHAIAAALLDLAGNRSFAASSFLVDTAPPATTLLVSGRPALAAALTAAATDTFAFAAQDAGSGVSETLFALDGAAERAFSAAFTLSSGTHALSFRSRDKAGNLEQARTVAVTVLPQDSVPPSLALTPADGASLTVATPTLRAEYSDAGGIDLGSVRLLLDGQDLSAQSAVTAASASFTPSAALAEGTHTLSASAADLAGNGASASAGFTVDTIPPVTLLRVNGIAAGAAVVAASTDSLSFIAQDAGTGVAEIQFSLDGGAEQAFAAPFTLGVGTHSLAFRARDRAGNLEAGKTALVTVVPADTATVSVRLDFPLPKAKGVAQAVGGTVRVRGAVAGNPGSWRLEVAPGRDARFGFAPLFSAAGDAAGALFDWNTFGLDGFYTLRLLASKAGGGAEAAKAVVFVGDPKFDFAAGKGAADQKVGLKRPEALIVRPDGKVWVASTGNDKLFLLTPQGEVLKVIRGHYKHDDDPFRLRSPSGLALDAQGNLFVADRQTHRLVKFSPDGASILLELGRRGGKNRFRAGTGPGEFRRPVDVAVSTAGTIFVLDEGNDRVQSFNADGAFLRAWPVPEPDGESRFRAITLTSRGTLWLSDHRRHRVHELTQNGTLLRSVGERGDFLGQFRRPRGTAADEADALYVAEDGEGDDVQLQSGGDSPVRGRVQKLDLEGRPLLAFGSREEATGPERKAKKFLRQPADAALAPDGALWVADTGQSRIVRYALPDAASAPIDATPPVTTLLVNGSLRAESSLVLAATDTLSLAAVDDLSGVLQTLYALDGGTEQVFHQPFTLAPGLRALSLRSEDNAGNAETARVVSALVFAVSGDTTPPLARLLSPAADWQGVAKVFNRTVQARARVLAADLAFYRLEAAPGQDAAAGFVFLASGTAPVDGGVVFAWDASAQSGLKTLRLTAADQAGNAVSDRVTVRLGEPELLLSAGDRTVLRKPSAVAVGPDGRIIAVDPHRHRLAIFSALGEIKAFIGRAPKGFEPRFRHPKGVAVGPDGSIWVADTFRHRLVKLGSDGAFLLAVGRVKVKDGRAISIRGAGPGQFHRPTGVAVGPDGAVFVADKLNRRVQKLSPAGAFVAEFTMPAIDEEPAEEPEDDGTGEEEYGDWSEEEAESAAADCPLPSAARGLPRAVAVDAAGNVYVSDLKGRRVVKLSPAGAFIQAFGARGTGPGRFRRPEGVAVDRVSGSVYVSDRHEHKIHKFDAQGNADLYFGRQHKLKLREAMPPDIVLRRPGGLAVDGEGNLFLADRGNQRVQKLGFAGVPQIVDSRNSDYEPEEAPEKKLVAAAVEQIVAYSGGGKLHIPAGALQQALEIVIAALKDLPAELGASAAASGGTAKLNRLSDVYSFGPDGVQFAQAVKLELPYDPARLTGAEQDVQIHYFDPIKREWEALPSVVDTSSKVVTAWTNHFSLYAAQEGDQEPQFEGENDAQLWAFGEVYTYPNPAKRGKKPIFHIELPHAERVSIRVYTVAGQLAYEAALTGAPELIDDGQGPQLAYEHAWDGHIPSGVYFFVIQAERGGSPTITTTGKMAVLR